MHSSTWRGTTSPCPRTPSATSCPRRPSGSSSPPGTITYAFSFLINGPLTDRIGGKKGDADRGSRSRRDECPAGDHRLRHPGVKVGAESDARLLGDLLDEHVLPELRSGGDCQSQRFLVSRQRAGHLRRDLRDPDIPRSLLCLRLESGRRQSHGTDEPRQPQYWLVFFIPAAILLFWVLVDFFALRDTPAQAGFADFDTGDASSGEAEAPFHLKDHPPADIHKQGHHHRRTDRILHRGPPERRDALVPHLCQGADDGGIRTTRTRGISGSATGGLC